MAAGTHVVIVGGGLAGWRAAEELRAAGFDGQLTMLSDEEHPPYDRPPLSKRLLKADVDAAPLVFAREGSDEQSLQLDLRRGVRATGLRPGAVLTEGPGGPGEVGYDALIIATGVRARELPELAGNPHVYLLRTFDDVLALRQALNTARSVLVIGAGFIGAEVATAAHDRGIAVTVIEAMTVPYQRALGGLLGGIVGRMAGRYGVELRTGVGVSDLLDEPGSDGVRVRLSDGSELSADLAVVGVGTAVNVEWLSEASSAWASGVTCDGSGRAEGIAAGFGPVYALGDVAAWHDAEHEAHLRFEHWTTAVDQAPIVAGALLRELTAGTRDAPSPEPLVPYFWSDQYGRKVQLIGRPALADDVEILHGAEPSEPDAPAPRKLVAGYFAADRLVAVASISAPALLGKYRTLLTAGAGRSQVRALAAELGG